MLQKIEKLFLYFMAYAIIGWLYEVFLEVVVYQWGYSDRGVLWGPYCPVYGFGAVIFILCFRPLMKKAVSPPLRILRLAMIFLGCMAVATGIELFTSYVLEYFSGSWPWQTYGSYVLNFEGRIALSPSLRFGLGGVIFLYLIQPFLEKLTAKMSPQLLTIYAATLFVLIAADFLFYCFGF